jgi:hypothetical protein
VANFGALEMTKTTSEQHLVEMHLYRLYSPWSSSKISETCIPVDKSDVRCYRDQPTHILTLSLSLSLLSTPITTIGRTQCSCD